MNVPSKISLMRDLLHGGIVPCSGDGTAEHEVRQRFRNYSGLLKVARSGFP